MKTTTKLWHMLIITLALLITACGGNSGSAGSSADGGGPVNWDYETCNLSDFNPLAIPNEKIEKNLYTGQSVIKQGILAGRGTDSFQFSLQESGTITVSESSVRSLINNLLSANDCTSLPLTGKVPKGPYYVSIINNTPEAHEYTVEISLE